ncbi:MAG: hypothetical protein WBW33_07650, partial [Bryobacteraceae bacterium]
SSHAAMRPHFRFFAIALIASLIAGAQQKSADDVVNEHRTAAHEALAAKDYEAYRKHLLVLGGLLNHQAEITYALAAADALLGHPTLAIDELNEFAATGLSRDAAHDPRFSSLRNLPAFSDVARRLQANGRPISHSSVVYSLPDPDLIAEDIAYDSASQTFFVSSVHKRKIVAVHADGSVTDFVSSGQDAVWPVFALAIDSHRHLLWATTAAVPEGLGFEKADTGKTALLCYDIATRKLLKRYDLTTDGSSPHALGDMTLSPLGDVYVSDGYGRVYTLPSGANALESLSKRGEFRSPQTPALTPDGKRLFVADYSLGVGVIDLQSKGLSWLPHAKEIALEGTDGLYLRGHSLIAVQNGVTPSRVVQVFLTPDLARADGFSVLEQASPSFGDPTHGVVVGNSFYFIGNSGWNRMSDDGKLTPGKPNDCPVVMEMKLEPEH